METDENGWQEYKRMIMDVLSRLEKTQDHIHEELHAYQQETAAQLTQLKQQSGVWGLLAGAIPVLVALSIAIIVKVYF